MVFYKEVLSSRTDKAPTCQNFICFYFTKLSGVGVGGLEEQLGRKKTERVMAGGAVLQMMSGTVSLMVPFSGERVYRRLEGPTLNSAWGPCTTGSLPLDVLAWYSY